MGAPRRVRPAAPQDLEQVARVFCEAFSGSVRHVLGEGARNEAVAVMAYLFGLCLRADPASFFVAAEEDRVQGYVVAPADLGAIWRQALRPEAAFGLVRLWWGLRERRWRPVRTVLGDKGAFFTSALLSPYRIPARILSLAVASPFRGRGIAGELLREALASLARRGATRVRLEVRPDNGPALRLYRRAGFSVVARTRDGQGDWLIMVKELRETAGPAEEGG